MRPPTPGGEQDRPVRGCGLMVRVAIGSLTTLGYGLLSDVE
jgi:hypothetical protein